MSEERFCSNCRLELPPDAAACPACGVYSGDVFDGRMPRERRPSNVGFWLALLVVAIGAAAWAVWMNVAQQEAPVVPARRVEPPPAPKIVAGRVTEADAIRLLRRHLVATYGVKNECVAIMGGRQDRGAFVLTAVDSCARTRFGRWRVDAKTGEVSKAAP